MEAWSGPSGVMGRRVERCMEGGKGLGQEQGQELKEEGPQTGRRPECWMAGSEILGEG